MNKNNYLSYKISSSSFQSRPFATSNFVAAGTSIWAIAFLFNTCLSISISKSDGSVAVTGTDSIGRAYGDAGYQNLVSYNSSLGIYLLIGSIILTVVLIIRYFVGHTWITLFGLMLSAVLVIVSLINISLISSVIVHTPYAGDIKTDVNILDIFIPLFYVAIMYNTMFAVIT